VTDREVLTWERFGTAARDLATTVAADGYRPDVILSIARGGLLVGGALSYALDVKSCYLVNIEFYTGIDERREEPIVLPPRLDLAEAQDARVLVVDDVADTGHTLARVAELLHERVAESRTAVLYEKPRSLIRCEYVWQRTDAWIEFPWSSQPAVV
jgi:uncharacterized protein